MSDSAKCIYPILKATFPYFCKLISCRKNPWNYCPKCVMVTFLAATGGLGLVSLPAQYLAKWCTWQTALQIWPILWNNEIDEVSHFLLTSNSETMTLSQILEKMCIEEIVFPQRISTPDLTFRLDFDICQIYNDRKMQRRDGFKSNTCQAANSKKHLKSTLEKSSTKTRSPFEGWQNLSPFRGEMVQIWHLSICPIF